MGLLGGKVIVVTGSTRGFGLAIAHACAAEGARLVVSGRRADAVAQALKDLRMLGFPVTGQTCDVADLVQVEALAAHARDVFGGFDVWINNAGVPAPWGPTVHIQPEAFLPTIETNIRGTYHGSLVAMRHFLIEGRGKLINILGRGDRGGPVPMQNAYASSKAWIRSFTLSLAKEYRGSGVGVFALNPGMMPTEFLTRVEAVRGYESRLRVMPTIIRLLSNAPEIPAQKVVWLASSATDGRTGLEIHPYTVKTMAGGVVREILHRLGRRPAAEQDVEVLTVPPAIGWPARDSG